MPPLLAGGAHELAGERCRVLGGKEREIDEARLVQAPGDPRGDRSVSGDVGDLQRGHALPSLVLDVVHPDQVLIRHAGGGLVHALEDPGAAVEGVVVCQVALRRLKPRGVLVRGVDRARLGLLVKLNAGAPAVPAPLVMLDPRDGAKPVDRLHLPRSRPSAVVVFDVGGRQALLGGVRVVGDGDSCAHAHRAVIGATLLEGGLARLPRARVHVLVEGVGHGDVRQLRDRGEVGDQLVLGHPRLPRRRAASQGADDAEKRRRGSEKRADPAPGNRYAGPSRASYTVSRGLTPAPTS